VRCGAQDALAPVDGLTGAAGTGVNEPDQGEQVGRQQRGLGTVAVLDCCGQHSSVRGADLLSQALPGREERNAAAIASHESVGGWPKTFSDPRLCAAIVDRLTCGGTFIETGTDSYRLARTRARTTTGARPD
jgi:hypothetical protein